MKIYDIKKLINEEIENLIREDSSWKRYLDPYTYAKGKESFKYREKKFTKNMIKDLIKYSKDNGYTVEQGEESIYSYNDESLKLGDHGREVWNYWKKTQELYYGVPGNTEEFVDIINKITMRHDN